MKFVLDTNIMVIAVAPTSRYHWIFQKLLAGEFTICVTTDILDEYAEIIERFFDPSVADFVLETFSRLPNVLHVTRYFRWELITADPDDNKFVDCALVSGAGYIVTDDKHFNVLKKVAFPKAMPIKIEQFKVLLETT